MGAAGSSREVCCISHVVERSHSFSPFLWQLSEVLAVFTLQGQGPEEEGAQRWQSIIRHTSQRQLKKLYGWSGWGASGQTKVSGWKMRIYARHN